MCAVAHAALRDKKISKRAQEGRAVISVSQPRTGHRCIGHKWLSLSKYSVFLHPFVYLQLENPPRAINSACVNPSASVPAVDITYLPYPAQCIKTMCSSSRGRATKIYFPNHQAGMAGTPTQQRGRASRVIASSNKGMLRANKSEPRWHERRSQKHNKENTVRSGLR